MLKLKAPKIKEIIPKVFIVTMDNQFDLAMTFCRFQEYFESSDMHGKKFTFMEFMRYYAKKWGKPKGVFSYTYDWNGFNIPGNILRACLTSNYEYNTSTQRWTSQYINEYEVYMLTQILDPIVKMNKGWDFYLIGVHTQETKKMLASLISHEVAHGLYYTNSDYKKEMDDLIKQSASKPIAYMKKRLKHRGYAKHVMQDELQAYLATGLAEDQDARKVRKEKKEFFKVIKKYKRDAKQYDEAFKGDKK